MMAVNPSSKRSLHIPHKAWAMEDPDAPRKDFENWKALERWADRLFRDGVGADPVPVFQFKGFETVAAGASGTFDLDLEFRTEGVTATTTDFTIDAGNSVDVWYISLWAAVSPTDELQLPTTGYATVNTAFFGAVSKALNYWYDELDDVGSSTDPSVVRGISEVDSFLTPATRSVTYDNQMDESLDMVMVISGHQINARELLFS